jgi:hypothetical protein
MIKSLLAIILSFCLALSITSPALALSPLDPLATDQMDLNAKDIIDGNFNANTDGNSVNVIIAQVLKVFFGLLGTIFIILMIISGYNWLTSRGDEKKIGKSKDTIQAAVIGLILTLAAYIITYFVFLAVPGSV